MHQRKQNGERGRGEGQRARQALWDVGSCTGLKETQARSHGAPGEVHREPWVCTAPSTRGVSTVIGSSDSYLYFSETFISQQSPHPVWEFNSQF